MLSVSHSLLVFLAATLQVQGAKVNTETSDDGRQRSTEELNRRDYFEEEHKLSIENLPKSYIMEKITGNLIRGDILSNRIVSEDMSYLKNYLLNKEWQNVLINNKLKSLISNNFDSKTEPISIGGTNEEYLDPIKPGSETNDNLQKLIRTKRIRRDMPLSFLNLLVEEDEKEDNEEYYNDTPDILEVLPFLRSKNFQSHDSYFYYND